MPEVGLSLVPSTLWEPYLLPTIRSQDKPFLMSQINSSKRVLAAYDDGERLFIGLELDDQSFHGVKLSGATFQNCFLSCDFGESNLTGTRFENCNLKTASFKKANLTNATITNCSVECVEFKNANVQTLVFEHNFYMGNIMQQNDLSGFC